MSASLVTAEIQANGSVIPDTYQVTRIIVHSHLNRINQAVIHLLDGDVAKQTFEISEAKTFTPGTKITIKLGYSAKNKTVFTGIVTKQNLKINKMGSMLVVECRDTAIKMTVGKKNAIFKDKKDSDVISSLITTHGGISADVTATTEKLPELVQYYTTDWDFMLSRAEKNGMVVSTENNKVTVFPPTKKTESVHTISYGDNLFDLNVDLNAVTQIAEVEATSWDASKQEIVSATASNSLAGPGNLSSKKLSDVVGLSKFELQTTANVTKDGLTEWSKAQMLKRCLSKIMGEVRCQGVASVHLGSYITLEGVGERFNGKHFVSGVKHEYAEGNWFSTISIGLSPVWFTQHYDVMAPPASGLLPGIEGLFNAKVKKIDEDPDNHYRILITLPLMGEVKDIWARLSQFYASEGFGAFFLPEVGDEVIVGFLNQDPRYPIILGSLYSKKRKPFSELKPDPDNSKKAIVTKSETRIVFDDKESILTITTKNKNVIVLDDKNKKITIDDENDNKISLSSAGIDIKTPKNINLQAGQQVNITGKTGIKLESASGDVKIEGLNVNAEAKMNLNAKANLQAAVQGGAELTLKGTMVMIN